MFLWIINEINFKYLRLDIFHNINLICWYYSKGLLEYLMYNFSSFAIGGFVPSAAAAGTLLLTGIAVFFHLGIKGPKDY